MLVIADEPAQWPTNDGQRMYTALMTALGKHQLSRLIAIGTRPDDSHHWFSRMLYGGRHGTYAQVHAPTVGADDFSKRSIREANPALYRMPALAEAVEREKHLAKKGGPDLASWRTYRLNRGTPELGTREKIVTLDDWNACVYERRDLPKVTGPVAIGFDLGGTASMSALAAYWPETGLFVVRGAFGTIPDLAIRGRNDEVDDRYVVMKDRGEFRVYPGRVTNEPAQPRPCGRRPRPRRSPLWPLRRPAMCVKNAPKSLQESSCTHTSGTDSSGTSGTAGTDHARPTGLVPDVPVERMPSANSAEKAGPNTEPAQADAEWSVSL